MRETSEQGRQGAPVEGPCRPSRGSEQPPPLHCAFSSRMGLGARAGLDASPAPSDKLPLSSPRLASCPVSWPSAAPGHCPLQAPRAAPSITPTPATLGGELRRVDSVSGAPGWGQLGHGDRSTCPRCRVLQSCSPAAPGGIRRSGSCALLASAPLPAGGPVACVACACPGAPRPVSAMGCATLCLRPDAGFLRRVAQPSHTWEHQPHL